MNTTLRSGNRNNPNCCSTAFSRLYAQQVTVERERTVPMDQGRCPTCYPTLGFAGTEDGADKVSCTDMKEGIPFGRGDGRQGKIQSSNSHS